MALSHGKVLTRSELALRACSRTARGMAGAFDEEASNLASAKPGYLSPTHVHDSNKYMESHEWKLSSCIDVHVSSQSLFSRFGQ